MTTVAPASVMTATGLVAFYKTRYPQREIENLVKYEKPFLSAVPHVDDLEGDSTLIPFQLDVPQGQSAALQTALKNVTASVGARWVITPAAYYGGLTIDAKSMRAARSNMGAWIRLREREYEGKLDGMGQEFERQCWGTGSGSLGRLSADPATGTSCSLTQAEDSINLHMNMKVNFYADDGSGNPTGAARAGGPYTISTFDEVNGTFELSGAADAAIASGDHIVREGDVNVLAQGVPSWIPRTDPGATSFFGITRTNYPTQKVSGWRGVWKGTIEETIKALDARIRRANQRGKVVWLSYSNYNRLDLELGARAIRNADESSHSFGSSSLKMTTPGGGVTVRTGPYVPEDYFWLLDMSTWKIHTLDALPHIVDDDGLTALRIGGGDASQAQDGIEIRMRGWWQPVCDNPYANGCAPIN